MSLPLGYALRDEVLDVMVQHARLYAPGLVTMAQRDDLGVPDRKLEQVLSEQLPISAWSHDSITLAQRVDDGAVQPRPRDSVLDQASAVLPIELTLDPDNQRDVLIPFELVPLIVSDMACRPDPLAIARLSGLRTRHTVDTAASQAD